MPETKSATERFTAALEDYVTERLTHVGPFDRALVRLEDDAVDERVQAALAYDRRP